MKHLFITLAIAGIFAIALSCKKDNTVPVSNTSDTSSDTFTHQDNAVIASVDGIAVQIDSIQLAYIDSHLVILAAHEGTFESVSISVPQNISQGTYDASYESGSSISLHYTSEQNGLYVPNVGDVHLVVSENDLTHQVLKGTFHGMLNPPTGSDPHLIDGSFVVNY